MHDDPRWWMEYIYLCAALTNVVVASLDTSTSMPRYRSFNCSAWHVFYAYGQDQRPPIHTRSYVFVGVPPPAPDVGRHWL